MMCINVVIMLLCAIYDVYKCSNNANVRYMTLCNTCNAIVRYMTLCINVVILFSVLQVIMLLCAILLTRPPVLPLLPAVKTTGQDSGSERR